MTRSSRYGIALTALAITLLTGEWVALRRVAPRSMDVLHGKDARTLLEGGEAALRDVSSRAVRGATRLQGDRAPVF